MDAMVQALIVLNITLGLALFVARMAQLDRRHVQRVRQQQAYKSHFRKDR